MDGTRAIDESAVGKPLGDPVTSESATMLRGRLRRQWALLAHRDSW
jgi:hypothetical protein